jgi:hypothetical protein
MLRRVGESHGYGTRSARTARSARVVGAGGHKLVGYRFPVEWSTLTEEHRAMGLVGSFKRSSNGDFLVDYEVFECGEVGCRVCGN